jgi:hypothetical protein
MEMCVSLVAEINTVHLYSYSNYCFLYFASLIFNGRLVSGGFNRETGCCDVLTIKRLMLTAYHKCNCII